MQSDTLTINGKYTVHFRVQKYLQFRSPSYVRLQHMNDISSRGMYHCDSIVKCIIVTVLLRMLSAEVNYPSSKNWGILTLVPKKDNDFRYFEQYMTISLLNADCKILTNILARRMQFIISYNHLLSIWLHERLIHF